jgi:hypothetical protein
LNILVSVILQITGLSRLRDLILRRRQRKLSENGRKI